MAKGRGGDELAHFDMDELVDLQDTKQISGITGKLLKIFVGDFRKSKDELIKLEQKRLNREGTEQEKQKAHNALVRHAKEKILDSMTEFEKTQLEELNQRIRFNEKQLEVYKKQQKDANEIYKLEEAKLRSEIANAKKAGEATAILEQQLKDKQAQFKKEDTQRNKEILDAQLVLDRNRNSTGQIYAPYEIALQNEFRASGIDMSRVSNKDYALNEHGLSADLEHTLKIADLNYQNGEMNSFAKPTGLGGKGSLDMDLGDDEPVIRTKPQQEKRPSPQEVANILSTDLGDLSAGIVSAVPDKMQQNLNQNMRDEELKHRTERESLTDQYREQVLENLKEQTYQLITIQENLHAIYDNMGQGGSGGGLLGGLGDMLSSLAGGALASKGMGLVKGGLGLAKGALTKIALPLAVANGAFEGVKGGFNTDAIMAQKGFTDPSQVGVADRIHYGLSGMLSGLTGGLIGTDTIANFTERAGNFVMRDGFVTKREMKDSANSQAQQAEAEMNALLASQGIIQTSDGSYQIKDNSIHGQILEKMGIETAKVQQEQELAELNEGMGGVMNSSVSNVTNNNTTNVIPESPRFRVNDTATMALSAQGL